MLSSKVALPFLQQADGTQCSDYEAAEILALYFANVFIKEPPIDTLPALLDLISKHLFLNHVSS